MTRTPFGLRAALLVLAAACAHPAGGTAETRPPAACGGSEEPSLDRMVEAAFVYNFARFVSWPPGAPHALAPTFNIGVLGEPPLAAALEVVARDRKLGGRPVVVLRFAGVEDVVPCPVLYVGREPAQRLSPLLARLRGWSTITVGDAPGFASGGGVIGLYPEDGRIRFEVRRAAARAAGLGVSSNLLRLSKPEPDRPESCQFASGEER